MFYGKMRYQSIGHYLFYVVFATVKTSTAFKTFDSIKRVNIHDNSINNVDMQKHSSTINISSNNNNDSNHIMNNKEERNIFDRRSLLSKINKAVFSTGGIVSLNMHATHAIEPQIQQSTPPIDLLFESPPSEKELVQGLLETRVNENLLSPPTYGLEIPDVYYPEYFSGVWKVTSICTDVFAPCGTLLFGGNNTYQSALRTIGLENALQYKARFITSSTESATKIIADRDYNVREIAKSAMGGFSVLDIPIATPNRFSITLAPENSNTMLSVDLLSLARRQEYIDSSHFHCSEVVRQIIQPLNRQQRSQNALPTNGRGPVLKEIETISLYTSVKPGAEIRAKQRTATFLMPSQTDPMAMKMWEVSKGKPIDVRFYDVIYTKI